MEPTLYIILRNDLKWSLTSYQKLIQTSYISIHYIEHLRNYIEPYNNIDAILAHDKWLKQKPYGKVVILEASKEQLTKLKKKVNLIDLVDKDYPISIPEEIIKYSTAISRNLKIKNIKESDEQGICKVTMEQYTGSWVFIYNDQGYNNLEKECKGLGIT